VSDIGNVFLKIFGKEFYRLNAGFFIIIITLTFGFMSDVEHKALAEFFVASPLLSLIPVAVWIVYTIKVILFNRQRLHLAENQFLLASSQLAYSTTAVVAFQTLFFQFMPVVLYGSFLILMGIKHNLLQSVSIIIGAVIFLISLSSVALIRSLKTPIHEPQTSALKKFIDKYTIRPIGWIYAITVLRKEPFLFFGTKIFAGLLLFAVMRLYINETYDERLLAMAAAFAGIGNFMVMMQMQLFDFKYFIIMKSLPISHLQRWSYVVLITFIFVLPEIVLIVKYSPPLPLVELFSIMLLIPALALMVYSLLYIRFKNEESYGRLTFALAIAHVVLILFKVPISVFVIVNLLASWLIFRSRYYKFEILPTAKE
jgi:hypothetical protein